MRKSIAAAAASLLVTSLILLAPAGVANADGMSASRSGTCNMGARYTMTVRERVNPNRLVTTFYINATKGHRAWMLTLKHHNTADVNMRKVSNYYGNVRFVTTIAGQGTDLVSITVKSGYSEICKASLRAPSNVAPALTVTPQPTSTPRR